MRLLEHFSDPIISLSLSGDGSYVASVTEEYFKVYKLKGPTGHQQILRCPRCEAIQYVTGEGQIIHSFRGKELSLFDEDLVPEKRMALKVRNLLWPKKPRPR